MVTQKLSAVGFCPLSDIELKHNISEADLLPSVLKWEMPVKAPTLVESL